jgi:hypothetical protein
MESDSSVPAAARRHSAAAPLSCVISSRSAATTRCNSTIYLLPLFDNQALQRRGALYSVA